MRHLRGQGRRHGLEVERLAAVVDGHLPPLPMAQHIPEALQHAAPITPIMPLSFLMHAFASLMDGHPSPRSLSERLHDSYLSFCPDLHAGVQ